MKLVLKFLLSRLISLRAVVVVLALVLLLPSLRPLFPSVGLDRQLLNITGTLFNSVANRENEGLDIIIVDLPDDELELLAIRPGASFNTIELLRNISARSNAIVSLIVESFVPISTRQDVNSLQKILAVESNLANKNPVLFKEIERVVKNEHDYYSWLDAGTLSLAVIGDAQSGSLPKVPIELLMPVDYIVPDASLYPPFMEGFPDVFQSYVWQWLTSHSLAYKNELSHPIFLYEGEKIAPSLSLQMYRKWLNKNNAPIDAGSIWFQSQYLTLADQKLPLGPQGRIYLTRGGVSDAAVSTKHITLERALKSLPQADMILLAAEGEQAAIDIANILLSLQQRRYLYTPVWFVLIEFFVVVLFAVFLVLVIPHLGFVSGFIATALVGVMMIVGQIAWQIINSQYLPLGLGLQYLLVGYCMMLLWLRSNRKIKRLSERCHQASLLLAKNLMLEGRYDEALLQLENCRTCEDSLSLIYQVALEQEKKRHYRDAARTYKSICIRKRRYKDAEKRAKELISFDEKSQATNAGLSLTQTLVLPEAQGGQLALSQPVLGRYEIERELGRGAMGVVYLGRDPKISRQVAIKTLSYAPIERSKLKEVKQRFFREAEAAGRLDHPSIVRVYDVGEERDLAYIAMDYALGKPLSDFTRQGELLAIDVVYKIIADVAEALDYAHRQKVVHRDIKPSNILFNATTRQVKVSDFGIARLTDDSKTRTGDVFGSPLYMAPEQLQGKKVGGAADIYSLGASFYQLLTGVGPFEGDSLANLTYKILNTKHKSVRSIRRDLPASASRIINKALQKDPAKRYSSGNEMAEALRKSMNRDFGKVA